MCSLLREFVLLSYNTRCERLTHLSAVLKTKQIWRKITDSIKAHRLDSQPLGRLEVVTAGTPVGNMAPSYVAPGNTLIIQPLGFLPVYGLGIFLVAQGHIPIKDGGMIISLAPKRTNIVIHIRCQYLSLSEMLTLKTEKYFLALLIFNFGYSKINFTSK